MTPNTAFAAEQPLWSPPQSPQSSAVTVAPIAVGVDWIRDAGHLVEELRGLMPDWDGYNSPAISVAAIESAYKLIRCMGRNDVPVPRVAPVTGGGVALTFLNASRVLELEVLPDGSVEFLCAEKHSGGSHTADEGQLSIPRLFEAQYLVDWLLAD